MHHKQEDPSNSQSARTTATATASHGSTTLTSTASCTNPTASHTAQASAQTSGARGLLQTTAKSVIEHGVQAHFEGERHGFEGFLEHEGLVVSGLTGEAVGSEAVKA